MARAGRRLRSDIRDPERWRAESEQWQAKTDQYLAEISDKLNALIDVVDKSIRRNGGKNQ